MDLVVRMSKNKKRNPVVETGYLISQSKLKGGKLKLREINETALTLCYRPMLV